MKLIHNPVMIIDGKPVETNPQNKKHRDKTIAYRIFNAHHTPANDDLFHLTFDSLTSHDITYVGIIQTARASGMQQFPVPYVLTNCHNTLCAVGGTINEDDHQFALSAAHKYGGIYVPPSLAVIHSYNREMMSGCNRMILGSDSHTRYGALGTIAIGEGGGEIAKQLVKQTYDIAQPEVVLVYLKNQVKKGIGPHDVALAIIKEVYENGFVKNCVTEFAGEGIHHLSQDFRNGIDVMTTETTCLTSIWETDEITEQYFIDHHRKEAYAKLSVEEGAYYDRMIEVDLSTIESMIALPMHPAYALPIRELKNDPKKYLREAEEKSAKQLNNMKPELVNHIDADGNIHVDQGIIAGCSGGIYENIAIATNIVKNASMGNGEFRLSVYPDSLPVYKSLVENGIVSDLIATGAIFREAFCGPCFGAGDTPATNEFSIRHTTRNFPNREGSKPNEGQISSVALMDARSIAATALHQGVLTGGDELKDFDLTYPKEKFDLSIYEKRVYNGWGKAEKDYPLRFGPNIQDWPQMPQLSNDMLIKIVSFIDDPVTTTDELIPSGETSSYRSNPLRLAEYTLSRRDPNYVKEAKYVQTITSENIPSDLRQALDAFSKCHIDIDLSVTNISSAIYANMPGDGSAREQAASCQRVLTAGANFAKSYATKRYHSNCINWGIVPFVTNDKTLLGKGNYVVVKDIVRAIREDVPIQAWVFDQGSVKPLKLSLNALSQKEKEILIAGSLINYYRQTQQ